MKTQEELHEMHKAIYGFDPAGATLTEFDLVWGYSRDMSDAYTLTELEETE